MSDVKGERKGSQSQTHSVNEAEHHVEADELQRPSLEELEDILHSAQRSCRHGDEVWPNLYLGDM